jgi:hypothetical protein
MKRTGFRGIIGMAAALSAALAFGLLAAGCESLPDVTGVSTYYVRANGNDSNEGLSERKPFKTLARAIEAASGGTVKTITVLGTLTVALPSITDTGAEEILITGRADADTRNKAVLQSPKSVDPFIVGGNSRIRFEHLTLTGGTRGGIRVNEGATVTLGQGAVVSGNSRNYGGGIVVDKGTLVLCGNALVTKNTANSGGGIAVLGSGTILMQDDALVSENETDTNSEGKDGEGGGVYAEGAEITLEGNAAIVNNKGYLGAGIYINSKSSLVIRGGASIRDNSTSYNRPQGDSHYGGSGGGAYIAGSFTMYDTAAVSGNYAVFGGVYIDTNGTLVMEDRSVIKGNTAVTGTESDSTLFGGSGGGVYLAGRLTMRGESSLDDNTASFGGGLFTASNSQAVLEGNASIRNGDTSRNTEKERGGYGGGVYLSGGTLVLKDDAVLADNSAHMAGGAYIGSNGILTLQDRAAVQRNRALRLSNWGGSGGGVIIHGVLTMRDVAQVSGNTALFSGGIDLSGKLILEGAVKITGNNATQDGGGVYINEGGSITGDMSLISGNNAGRTGADIYTAEE